MSSYINTNCTPCTTSQTVITPCDGCAMILSDSCVVRKTDPITCLGIAVDDTLHTMIDKIATKICSITLDWDCLTAPSTNDLNAILQGLVDNVVSNKLTFSSGFTVTPITGGCGSLVSYAGSGLTLTSTAGTITTGVPASSIILTPGSGTYNLQPSFANQARVLLSSFLTAGIGTNAVTNVVASYRLRWDNHMDFDGQITLSQTLLNSTSWTTSNGVFDLFNVSSTIAPDRFKVYPVQLELTLNGTQVGDIPNTYCGTLNAKLVVYPTTAGGKVQLVVNDCRNIIKMFQDMETYQPNMYLTGIVWLTTVQYYTV